MILAILAVIIILFIITKICEFALKCAWSVFKLIFGLGIILTTVILTAIVATVLI